MAAHPRSLLAALFAGTQRQAGFVEGGRAAAALDVASAESLARWRAPPPARGGDLRESVPEPAGAFVEAHARAAHMAADSRWEEAYDVFANEGLQPFVRWFREAEDAAFAVPVMEQVAKNVYALAAAAERASGSMAAAGENSRLSNAGMKLQNCFSEAFNPKKDRDKKMACLTIVITMFRLYFAINTLHLCKNLVNSMAARNAPNFDDFPASQRAAYRYYTGRLLVFEDRFAEADEHLQYALRNIPPVHASEAARRNRRRVLAYLIPVRMLLGRMPSDRLLAESGLDAAYGPIKRACVTGDLGAFNAAMEASTVSHIQLGTFLLVERLRMLAQRTLLKRVHLVTQPSLPPTNFQLDLHSFRAALAMCHTDGGDPPDIEEAECIVVNLIYRKAVKGYVSHKLRKAVLSKKDAFPRNVEW